MNIFRKINNYLSFYWFIVLYGCVLYAFIKIGRLPELGKPDPKEVISNFSIFFSLFNYSTFFILLGLILNGFYLFNMFREKNRSIDFSLYFFMMNTILWMILFFIDPYGFKEWFFD